MSSPGLPLASSGSGVWVGIIALEYCVDAFDEGWAEMFEMLGLTELLEWEPEPPVLGPLCTPSAPQAFKPAGVYISYISTDTVCRGPAYRLVIFSISSASFRPSTSSRDSPQFFYH